LGITELHAEAPPAPADLRIEERKPRGLTKEANRDLISPQHLQVKRSWENPGVYAWGSNSGKVVAPDSDETYIKTPRRIPFFDGMLLRDIKLDRNFGAAITEDGDLLQWGTAYSTETRLPTRTLTGKNLASLTISKDRIIALSPSGKIYSIPVSREDQLSGHRPPESTWVPFWSVKSPVAYRTIEPPFRVWYERVSSIASGLEHLLILTSTGRLFTAAASSEDFPSKGQLGIPGLTWTNRSAGRYDQPHEITTLRGFDIRAIAAGDNHSLALDSEGRVFSFGDNISGQLGFDFQPESPTIDAPSLLPTHKLYPGTTKSTRVTSIAAGGNNSFLTVDAAYVPGQSEDSTARRGPERITADTWAFGQGIFGTLGTGRWTHAQGAPTKIKALSGLSEYDEAALSVVPIRLARLSVGSTHASATLANVTHVGAHAASGENDTNWGADVLWWGGNEYYQLGTGKRNNVASPLYIAPLDPAADRDSVARREHRFQATPRRRAQVGGRWVECEQRVECGRFVSAVYSHV
jgi:alpha-tubulin suppressor-like RCC1 family protein